MTGWKGQASGGSPGRGRVESEDGGSPHRPSARAQTAAATSARLTQTPAGLRAFLPGGALDPLPASSRFCAQPPQSFAPARKAPPPAPPLRMPLPSQAPGSRTAQPRLGRTLLLSLHPRAELSLLAQVLRRPGGQDPMSTFKTPGN